jgi:hypothetical protein
MVRDFRLDTIPEKARGRPAAAISGSIANKIENDNYGIISVENPTQLFIKIKYIFRTPDIVISSNSNQFI